MLEHNEIIAQISHQKTENQKIYIKNNESKNQKFKNNKFKNQNNVKERLLLR